MKGFTSHSPNINKWVFTAMRIEPGREHRHICYYDLFLLNSGVSDLSDTEKFV